MGSPQQIRKRDEPTVREPRVVRDILQDVGAQNIPSVENALSINAYVFDEIPTVRIFFAHRNFDTAKKVRKLGLSIAAQPELSAEALVTRNRAGSRGLIFNEWCGETATFFEECLK
ncbi:MAG: hypothetical protein AAF968_06690 [Pseudomonadota bacterium]